MADGIGGFIYPIGTREETDALGLDPADTGTCSLQKRGNRGCAFYGRCRFREIKGGHKPAGHDRALKGPENVAVYVQLSPRDGRAATIHRMPCYDYYVSKLHARWTQMEVTGERIKVLGIAGDGKKYKVMETVKAHAIKDPNCQNCATNTCIIHKVVVGPDGKLPETPLDRFKRPDEAFRAMALGQDIGQQIIEDVEREMEREAFDVQIPAQEPVTVAEVVEGGKARSRTG